MQPDIGVLVLTVSAFGLIAWASLSSQEFLTAARHSPGIEPKQALRYTGAEVGLLTWMHQQAWAGTPSLTGLGTAKRAFDVSSAQKFASKAVSRDSADYTTSVAVPAAQPAAAADAVTAAPAPRPSTVADGHALSAASAPGSKARPEDAAEAPAPLPAAYMGASRSRAFTPTAGA